MVERQSLAVRADWAMSNEYRLREPTSIDEYARIKELLCDLVELKPADREAVARSAVAGDPVLLDRVLIMLQGLEPEEEFLEGELPDLFDIGSTGSAIVSAQKIGRALTPGTMIGHFELLERIGEGGMAVVYRARQCEPVQREVALKLISAHASSTQRTRFERECDALARFTHPNVANLFESGESANGEPYAAIELIRGIPISLWARFNRASVEQRLRIFIDACLGIAHAHSKGILHRDIKPSNLLVTEVDGQPVVKVIDFGIAVALSPGLDPLSNLTGQHLIGTPAYMSPESVHASDHQALDARSDVYSLGVVLYELLSGKRPYDLHQGALFEWFVELSSRGVPAMGALFAALPESEKERIATESATVPGKLQRVLDSDLSAVVSQALALEPERRYANSLELARDLQAYLRGRPVAAHAPSYRYLAGKFVRRHWIGISATALIVLSLAMGFVAREIEAGRTRQALAEANAVSEFIVDLLEHASPLRLEDDSVSLQDILDRGASELSQQFAEQPLVQARLMHTLGRVYGERGDYARGAELMAGARKLMSQLGATDDLKYVRLLSDYAVALRRQGNMNDAEGVLQEALQLAERKAGQDPLLLADVATSLGNIYVVREDWRSAEALHTRALQLREATLPPDDLLITSSRNNLTSTLIGSWQTERALPYAQQVLDAWQRDLPAGHPWIGIARNNLAIVLDQLGRKQESLQLFYNALGETQKRLGPGHPDISDLWRNIGISLVELDQREAGRAATREHVRILAESLGPDAPRTLAAERRLVMMLLYDRNYQQALESFESLRSRLLSSGNPDTNLLLQLGLGQAEALAGLNRYGEALAVIDAQRQSLLDLHPPVSLVAFASRLLEARIIGDAGDRPDAIQRLQTEIDFAGGSLSPQSHVHGDLLEELVRQELGAGSYELALEHSKQLLDFWIRIHKFNKILDAHVLVAQACNYSQDLNCAKAHLKTALDGYRLRLTPGHAVLVDAEDRWLSLQ